MQWREVVWAGLLVGAAALGAEPGAPRPTPPSTPATNAKWQITVSKSPDDNSALVSATLLADAPIASGFGQVTPSLVLRYRAGRTSGYVLYDTFLGRGEVEVTVTIGAGEPETQKWRISGDGRAALIPGDTLAFIQRLKQGGNLSVRVTPPKGTAVTAAFTTTGIERVVQALLSAGVKYSG